SRLSFLSSTFCSLTSALSSPFPFSYAFSLFCLLCSLHPRHLPSFPTRRSSDLQPHPGRARLEARLPAPGAPARAAVDARNRQARREVAAVPRVLVRRLTQRASSRIGGGIVPDELECCPDSDRIRITRSEERRVGKEWT